MPKLSSQQKRTLPADRAELEVEDPGLQALDKVKNT